MDKLGLYMKSNKGSVPSVDECECVEGSSEYSYKKNKLQEVLCWCDIFPAPINFTVDRANKEIKNSFGGIMSIIFMIIVALYLGSELVLMYQMSLT